jgi:2,3-bisphosphoglycerate-independent phosphoglycerate mutase
MNILFLFLDGVGLGDDDATANPLVKAEMPVLRSLLGGKPMIARTAPYHGARASLLALDAGLGVAGVPQSATGQAVLLTGVNVPAQIGYHYGPKPDPAVASYLRNGSLFSRLRQEGRRAALLSAYPPRYFEAIRSGRRMYSAIPLAASSAGLDLMTLEDLIAGRALAADFTAQAWHEHLGLPDTPLLTPFQAGQRLVELTGQTDLAFFEYWLSDYAGHHQDMEAACRLMRDFDQVLAGMLDSWDDEAGLILVTSDHGNMEDLSTRRHTTNPVPALLIGSLAQRAAFASGLHDLTGIYPAIMYSLLGNTRNQ